MLLEEIRQNKKRTMAHSNRDLCRKHRDLYYSPQRNSGVPPDRPASTGIYMSQWESKFHELVVSIDLLHKVKVTEARIRVKKEKKQG